MSSQVEHPYPGPGRFVGGCLCGQLRYAISEAPLHVSLCHCRDCQKCSGSAFSVNAVFREEAVTVTGRLAIYETVGDSGGTVRRVFCPDCGSTIRSMAEQTRGFFVVKAGTLDAPEQVVPSAEVYCASRIEAWRGPRVEHERLG